MESEIDSISETVENLKQINIHTEETTFNCDVTNRLFQTKSDLSQSQNEKNDQIATDMSVSDKGKLKKV